MISIDTNLLLYSLNPDSIWHAAAVSFLRQNLGVPTLQIAITDIKDFEGWGFEKVWNPLIP